MVGNWVKVSQATNPDHPDFRKHFKNNFQKKTGMASTRQGLEEMIQHGVKQEQQMARAHLAGYS